MAFEILQLQVTGLVGMRCKKSVAPECDAGGFHELSG